MRRLLMMGLILMLAACGASAQPPAAGSPPATATAAGPRCQFTLGLRAFPQGSLATASATDGWTTSHWQLAVNIDETIVLSATSRVIIIDTITTTMRVSTGRASAEKFQRLQALIASEAFAALEPCYEGTIADGGAVSLSAHTPRGLKTSDVWAGEAPLVLRQFWVLMSEISLEATIPVSTCVYVAPFGGSGPEPGLVDCE